MIISEKGALYIFFSIVVVAILAACYFKTFDSFEDHQFHTFIAVLSGLGIIILFLLYYNIIALQNEQQETNRFNVLEDINITILDDILNAMNEASVTAPAFVLSINPLTTNNITINVPDPDNTVKSITKTTLSYRIFSLWQDYVLLRNTLDIDSSTYLNNFLQRANSSELYELWIVSKLNFNTDTEKLGDLLFEYALPITVQIPQNYIDASDKLLADPRYQQIFS